MWISLKVRKLHAAAEQLGDLSPVGVFVDLRVSSVLESSKELEELRAAFSRALDYMKQDVEERTCLQSSRAGCCHLWLLRFFFSWPHPQDKEKCSFVKYTQ